MNRRTIVPSSRRASLVALVGLAMVLVLAACGGGGGTADAKSSDGTALSPLKMRVLGPTFTDLPTLVVLAQDYFTKVGLKVDFDFLAASNSAVAPQAVISGDMDVTSSGTGALILAFAAGKTQLVSLGTLNNGLTFGLALNNDAVAKMAAKGVTLNSPVTDRVQALKGMSIAASPEGSTGLKYLKTMLSAYGVNPDKDITVVPNSDNNAQLAAARSGRTDGFANSFPNTNLAEADGWGKLWLDFARDLPTTNSILPLDAQAVYTSRNWLAQHHDVAVKVMKAYWLALADLQNPTDELKQKVKSLPYFKDLNPKGFDLGWAQSIPVYHGATLAPTQQMFDNQLKLVNMGSTKPVQVSFKDLYDLGPVGEAHQ
jgi:NitT/TauT family transport system substrate-binding protein